MAAEAAIKGEGAEVQLDWTEDVVVTVDTLYCMHCCDTGSQLARRVAMIVHSAMVDEAESGREPQTG